MTARGAAEGPSPETPEDARVRRTYDAAARTYDAWARLFEGEAKRRCVAIAASRAPGRVLDVGVGTADLLRSLVVRLPRAEFHGVDLSAAMLARAQKKIAPADRGRCHLRLANARALPYADARFDLVACTYVIELVPGDEYARFLGEIARVLARPSALVLAGVVERPEARYRPARWACRKNPAWQGGFDVPRATRELGLLGARVVTEAFVPQRGVPCVVVEAAFDR